MAFFFLLDMPKSQMSETATREKWEGLDTILLDEMVKIKTQTTKSVVSLVYRQQNKNKDYQH